MSNSKRKVSVENSEPLVFTTDYLLSSNTIFKSVRISLIRPATFFRNFFIAPHLVRIFYSSLVVTINAWYPCKVSFQHGNLGIPP